MQSMPIVKDFMDKVFATVTPQTRMGEAVNVLMKKGLTGVLVVDDNRHLLGVLSEKDCLKTIIYDGFYRVPDETVEHFMHPPVRTVESSMGIMAAAQAFLDCPVRRLPVVDEGCVVGQITQRDIVRGMTAMQIPVR